jgi:hypothetical protein
VPPTSGCRQALALSIEIFSQGCMPASRHSGVLYIPLIESVDDLRPRSSASVPRGRRPSPEAGSAARPVIVN